jgi:hypothetical protein
MPRKSKKEYSIEEEFGFPDYNRDTYSHANVGSGSWILVTRTIPVEKHLRPTLYGIYWAVPNNDRFGRQSCKVHTHEDVVLLNHEYTVLTEEKVQEYRDEGWKLHECGAVKQELNMELIEKGRNLVEEEREVIWALQLDGLDEEQACEEYFLTKHTSHNNYTICYLPTDEIYQELVATFGER